MRSSSVSLAHIVERHSEVAPDDKPGAGKGFFITIESTPLARRPQISNLSYQLKFRIRFSNPMRPALPQLFDMQMTILESQNQRANSDISTPRKLTSMYCLFSFLSSSHPTWDCLLQGSKNNAQCNSRLMLLGQALIIQQPQVLGKISQSATVIKAQHDQELLSFH